MTIRFLAKKTKSQREQLAKVNIQNYWKKKLIVANSLDLGFWESFGDLTIPKTFIRTKDKDTK